MLRQNTNESLKIVQMHSNRLAETAWLPMKRKQRYDLPRILDHGQFDISADLVDQFRKFGPIERTIQRRTAGRAKLSPALPQSAAHFSQWYDVDHRRVMVPSMAFTPCRPIQGQ